ncbi:MAG: hypothetical protein GY826_13535, partial [Fuerstiella sp.]|nr:hypothetical protein [Fuerstiella sp.]
AGGEGGAEFVPYGLFALRYFNLPVDGMFAPATLHEQKQSRVDEATSVFAAIGSPDAMDKINIMRLYQHIDILAALVIHQRDIASKLWDPVTRTNNFSSDGLPKDWQYIVGDDSSGGMQKLRIAVRQESLIN